MEVDELGGFEIRDYEEDELVGQVDHGDKQGRNGRVLSCYVWATMVVATRVILGIFESPRSFSGFKGSRADDMPPTDMTRCSFSPTHRLPPFALDIFWRGLMPMSK